MHLNPFPYRLSVFGDTDLRIAGQCLVAQRPGRVVGGFVYILSAYEFVNSLPEDRGNIPSRVGDAHKSLTGMHEYVSS